MSLCWDFGASFQSLKLVRKVQQQSSSQSQHLQYSQKKAFPVVLLCAEFGPVGKAACTSRCTLVEKLESNEETVEEFYSLVLLFSSPLKTVKYFIMPNVGLQHASNSASYLSLFCLYERNSSQINFKTEFSRQFLVRLFWLNQSSFKAISSLC